MMAKSEWRGTRKRISALVSVAALAAFAAGASRANAQVEESEFRAADGTTYQVIRAQNLGGSAERLQITTVGGAIAGAGSCAATGNMSGDAASAIGGVLPPGMSLHPYAQVRRTAVLVPNDVSVLSFNSAFGGRVTLGMVNGTQLNVCISSFDCTAQPNVQALSALDVASGGVPKACIA